MNERRIYLGIKGKDYFEVNFILEDVDSWESEIYDISRPSPIVVEPDVLNRAYEILNKKGGRFDVSCVGSDDFNCKYLLGGAVIDVKQRGNSTRQIGVLHETGQGLAGVVRQLGIEENLKVQMG